LPASSKIKRKCLRRRQIIFPRFDPLKCKNYDCVSFIVSVEFRQLSDHYFAKENVMMAVCSSLVATKDESGDSDERVFDGTDKTFHAITTPAPTSSRTVEKRKCC
jgi:hypothetical protein